MQNMRQDSNIDSKTRNDIRSSSFGQVNNPPFEMRNKLFKLTL